MRAAITFGTLSLLNSTDRAIVEYPHSLKRSLMMLDWTQCPAVERIPGKVSGAWVFKTTRVPFKALFEYLDDGAAVNDFLDWFPGVSREQVLAVLEFAEQSVVIT